MRRWFLLGTAVTAATLASVSAAAVPTRAQVVARTKAAVRASRATLVSLKVAVPHASYGLVIKVSDPAAYLRHRANTVVDTMNRLTDAPRARFTRVQFTIENEFGRRVFSYNFMRHANGSSGDNWWIERRYVDCARTIDLDIEVDPERVAPPCPVS